MDRHHPVRVRGTAPPAPAAALRPALLLAVAVAVVAASMTFSPPPTRAATVAANASVEMGDDFFRPSSVTVAAGDTVTWTNGGDDHTVTADDNSFDSGNMVGGDTYRRTFDTAGSYSYVCAYHDDMRGTVVVTEANEPPPPPPAPRVVARVVSFGPNPLRLAGRQRVRAVYRIGQASTLRANVQRLRPTRTVRAFPRRTTRGAGRVTYFWDGKTNRRRDVRPGRYRMNLTVTDRAGNRRVVRTAFRVVR
jgi:plastocyanin